MPGSDFAQVIEELGNEPGVVERTGFGKMPGLRVEGRIFAMLVEDELVVKLPAARCSELVEDGAAPFVIGRRQMREWVSVGRGASDWPGLAREALLFVRG